MNGNGNGWGPHSLTARVAAAQRVGGPVSEARRLALAALEVER